MIFFRPPFVVPRSHLDLRNFTHQPQISFCLPVSVQSVPSATTIKRVPTFRCENSNRIPTPNGLFFDRQIQPTFRTLSRRSLAATREGIETLHDFGHSEESRVKRSLPCGVVEQSSVPVTIRLHLAASNQLRSALRSLRSVPWETLARCSHLPQELGSNRSFVSVAVSYLGIEIRGDSVQSTKPP